MRAFLFADPAAHSRSPVMHRAAFRAAGLNGHYEARRVTPAELPAAVAGLRQPGVLGANLSLPHKEAVIALLDDLTPAARAIGAVNTVIHRAGRLTGDNTDAPGLLAALRAAGDTGHGDVLVLGAGGAARAAVWALSTQGRAVSVLNRTWERAVALTRELGGHARRPGEMAAVWPGVQLIVNASSAGLAIPDAATPDTTPLPDFPSLERDALVYDMVYKPAQTRLMRDARAAGHRAENGLGMLAEQARLAFLAWTGQDVPVSVFLEALHAEQGGAVAREP